jgi:hypothetical protein
LFDPPIDEAELDRIEKETTEWYTTEQVLAHLHAVEGA